MKSRRGCRLGISCYCPPHDHRREQGNERKLLRGESEGCQRACHLCFRTAVLHETHETAASQWICRAPARDVGKAKSYQSSAISKLTLSHFPVRKLTKSFAWMDCALPSVLQKNRTVKRDKYLITERLLIRSGPVKMQRLQKCQNLSLFFDSRSNKNFFRQMPPP